ncbi:hypothetical protein IFM89_039026 [Coptis chinensis]|uniref:F-box domain-containing protein n=1 Tax=Coptis chinensis TaxID=261450 RepID=A0A835M8N4_9MAGN|nr:hypothetical protein IFM89_039026 [Coptis chinensis]
MCSFLKNLCSCSHPSSCLKHLPSKSQTEQVLERNATPQKLLPDSVIEDILSRLPVRSLLRFGCVCKTWCSLLRDPWFITMHLKHSQAKRDCILLKGVTNIYLLDYGTCNHIEIEKLNYPSHLLKSGGSIDVINLFSCNGLICLSTDSNTLCLWNPSTGRQKTLPQSVTRPNLWMYYTSLGFCYDPIADDYVVLKVYSSHGCPSVVEVYSLRKNSWMRIQNIPYHMCAKNKGTLFYGGSLHWVGNRSNCTISFAPDIVIAFDIATKTFRDFRLPAYERLCEDWERGVVVGSPYFLVLDGCLCILRSHDQLNAAVWVMKECGVSESWIKLHTVELHGLALTVTKKREILLQRHSSITYLYALKDKRIKPLITQLTQEPFCFATSFTESLVRL